MPAALKYHRLDLWMVMLRGYRNQWYRNQWGHDTV